MIRFTDALVDAHGRLQGAVGRRDDAAATRVLVPAVIPCGECERCRRALTALCLRTVSLSDDGLAEAIEIPDRFVVPIDDAAAEPMPARAALAALPIARLLEAAGRAGVGAGDVTIWIGESALAAAGAALAASRGARSFLVATSSAPPNVTALSPGGSRQGWDAALAPVDSPASGGGFQERRVFVADAHDRAVDAALQLLGDGGGTLVLLAAPAAITLHPARLPLVRVIVHAGAHPDFLTEALAAVARGEIAADAVVDAEPIARPTPVRSFALRA